MPKKLLKTSTKLNVDPVESGEWANPFQVVKPVQSEENKTRAMEKAQELLDKGRIKNEVKVPKNLKYLAKLSAVQKRGLFLRADSSFKNRFKVDFRNEKAIQKLITLKNLFPRTPMLQIVDKNKKTLIKKGGDGNFYDNQGDKVSIKEGMYIDVPRSNTKNKKFDDYEKMMTAFNGSKKKEADILISKKDEPARTLDRKGLKKLNSEKIKEYYLKDTGVRLEVDFKGNKMAERYIGIRHMFKGQPSLIKVIDNNGSVSVAKWKNGDYRYSKTGKSVAIWQGYALWLPKNKNELASFKKEAVVDGRILAKIRMQKKRTKIYTDKINKLKDKYPNFLNYGEYILTLMLKNSAFEKKVGAIIKEKGLGKKSDEDLATKLSIIHYALTGIDGDRYKDNQYIKRYTKYVAKKGGKIRLASAVKADSNDGGEIDAKETTISQNKKDSNQIASRQVRRSNNRPPWMKSGGH